MECGPYCDFRWEMAPFANSARCSRAASTSIAWPHAETGSACVRLLRTWREPEAPTLNRVARQSDSASRLACKELPEGDGEPCFMRPRDCVQKATAGRIRRLCEGRKDPRRGGAAGRLWPGRCHAALRTRIRSGLDDRADPEIRQFPDVGVRFLRVAPILPYAYLPTFNLGQAAAVDDDFVPDAEHLLHLERPTECAARLREFPKENYID